MALNRKRRKLWQQPVAWFLVLCLVGAGAVGIDPVLHRFVEHSGQGIAHTHLGENVAAHSHAGGVAHSHDVPPRTAAPAGLDRLVERGEPLKMFGLLPQDIYRAAAKLLARAFDDGGLPVGESPGHTHHSLAQSLIAGTVEGAVTILPLVCAPERLVASATFPEERVAASELYLSTAGRAPPASV